MDKLAYGRVTPHLCLQPETDTVSKKPAEIRVGTTKTKQTLRNAWNKVIVCLQANAVLTEPGHVGC